MNVSKTELLIAAALLVGAGGLVFGHTRMPRSTPATAASDYFAAAAGADLSAMREVSTAAHYGEVQLRVSRPRFKVAQRVYQRTIPALAQADWQRMWRKVDLLAGSEYDRLHREVAQLGRQRFEELEATERLKLVNEPGGYEEFIYRRGVEALPLEDSRRIASTEAFRAKSDRKEFVANEGWQRLSDEDKALLGGPEALSEADTPDKLAFYDRVAVPRLDADSQAAIDGIARADVASLPVFASRHGERLLRETLEASELRPSTNPARCVFPREQGGSLFRGAQARCAAFLVSPAGSGKADTQLDKVGFEWRVADVSDRFFILIGRS